MSIFTPIQQFADLVTYQFLSIPADSYLAGAVNFFIYDTIKIGILLVVINYIMAITRYYFPMEKVRDILTKRNWYGFDYLLAALLGVVTPFCSCSSIPLFIGFLSSGIPLGVTFTFLISSPLVNESSLYLFPAVFGLKNTLIYNFVGIIVSIIGGILIQKLNMEKYVRFDSFELESKKLTNHTQKKVRIPLQILLKFWFKQSWKISKKVFPYVILGVGIGAVVHGFVPEELIVKYLSNKQWWTVPLAVLLGAPLYANSVGVIPIAEAVIGKGVPMGTTLAFMTATVTISIPEGLILAKLMKKQLLIAFFGITIIAIVAMGYLFNLYFSL